MDSVNRNPTSGGEAPDRIISQKRKCTNAEVVARVVGAIFIAAAIAGGVATGLALIPMTIGIAASAAALVIGLIFLIVVEKRRKVVSLPLQKIETSQTTLPEREAKERREGQTQRSRPLQATQPSLIQQRQQQLKEESQQEMEEGTSHAPTNPPSDRSLKADDAPSVDGPPMDAPPMDAPPMDAPPMDAPPMDAPPPLGKPVTTKTTAAKPSKAPPSGNPPDTGALCDQIKQGRSGLRKVEPPIDRSLELAKEQMQKEKGGNGSSSTLPKSSSKNGSGSGNLAEAAAEAFKKRATKLFVDPVTLKEQNRGSNSSTRPQLRPTPTSPRSPGTNSPQTATILNFKGLRSTGQDPTKDLSKIK